MASEAEVEEEPSEQFHYPQKAAVKRATRPAQVKPGSNTWPITQLHRIYPKAMLILITPELAGVPEKHRMWLTVAGKVPSRGSAALVTLQSESGETTYQGVFTELTPPRKLKLMLGRTRRRSLCTSRSLCC